MEVKGSEAQVRRREAGCKGSVEQTRESMNKNRIERPECRASGRLAAKPISIKSTEGRFGDCVRKAIELTLGDLLCVPESELRRP
jgi:hypothetical protein